MIITRSSAHPLVMIRPTGKTASLVSGSSKSDGSLVEAGAFNVLLAVVRWVKRPLTNEASSVESRVDTGIPSLVVPEKVIFGTRIERIVVLCGRVSHSGQMTIRDTYSFMLSVGTSP